MILGSIWRRGAVVMFLLCGAVFAAAAERVAWRSNRISGSPNPPAPFVMSRVWPGLKFENPVDFARAPGTNWIAVLEQGGKLWSFPNNFTEGNEGNNEPKRELAMDLRRVHQPFAEVLGFSFDPGFATNRFVYINYNEPGGREDGSFVSRFTAGGAMPLAIDPASEKVIIRWLSGGHNGCTLAFGNDGMLYISTGDAASPEPPDGLRRTGQDIGDLLASILRIDVHPKDDSKPYEVPRDNPFVNTQGARPEVWAFGFRNPFRMSIDPGTGDLWVGDVGWEQWEMVYRIKRGGNYGWAITEGPNLRVRSDVKQGPGEILPPMFAVPHTEGASITAGSVYRGQRLASIAGAFVYGDWETGKFWALRNDGDRLVSNEELCDTSLKPVAFGSDARGEMLVLDYNGGFYEFTPNNAAAANAAFPRKLSETGLFASVDPPRPAEGTVAYRVNAPMWNDYATAEWLLGVPGAEQIATSGGLGNIAGGTWYFPTNTALARTLTLEMVTGDAASKRRIETQLLHWDGQAWNPYTYRWNDEQNDAVLVESAGTNVILTVADGRAPGGKREIPWRFHSRAECLRCHNAWAGEALTLNWRQLNGAAGGELARLETLGVLKAKNRPREGAGALTNPYDASAPVEARARSWLDVNCSTCHRFGAGGGVVMYLDFEKKLREMRIVDEKPSRGDFGLDDARIVAAGEPYHSTMYYRISTEGAGRMPHIGSRLVDETGARLMREWIEARGTETVTKPARPVAEAVSSTSAALRLLDLLTTGADEKKRAEAVKLATASTNVIVRDLFQRLAPPDERRRTLGTEFSPELVLALNGNAARGKAVFHGVSQCSRCHIAGGEGRAFGPDLTGIAKKYDRAQLLEQIVSPSKAVAPEFKLTTVTLRDDTEINGFVVARTANELVIREESGERRLKASEIENVRESALSAMPEGMLAPLTPEEAADLLAYLATLGK